MLGVVYNVKGEFIILVEMVVVVNLLVRGKKSGDEGSV